MNTRMKTLLLVGMGFTFCIYGAFAQTREQNGHNRHDPKGRPYHDRNTSQRADKIYRITQADSSQKIKMKPAIDQTNRRIESLISKYKLDEKRIMDSLKLQLKPILKEDQLKRLDEWQDKKGQKGKGQRGSRRGGDH